MTTMKPQTASAGWGHYSMLCFYCRAAIFAALPTKCWHCGSSLSAKVTPEMKLLELSDLCVNNGKQLTFTSIPIDSHKGVK